MKLVKDFYKDTPFNFTEEIDFYTKSIKDINQVLEYKDLHNLLRKRTRFTRKKLISSVIEFGCGTGWLSNSLAYYYGKKIKGIDFTEKALGIAKSVSSKLKLLNTFESCDIFDYKDTKKYDLVISLGVLHHTKDCEAAFKSISKFVKPGGYLYVGLYHLYGRRPMLKYLKSHARWHGEESAYNLFKKMRKDSESGEHSYSWFRDQVLHPHETQHTLIEVNKWLNQISFTLKSCSINKYKNLDKVSLQSLGTIEKQLEAYSFKENVENLSFNPGYFTICAENSL